MSNKENKTLPQQKFHDILVIQIWRLIGTFVLGGLAGYLVFRSSQKEGNPNILYLFVVWGVITLIGVLVFTIMLLRARKHLLVNEIKEEEK